MPRLTNRIAIGGLAAGAFATGLLMAGILDLPAGSLAQEPRQTATVAARVEAPRPTSAAAAELVDLSEAFSSIADR